MLMNFFWNNAEKRVRAGWRILIQALMVMVPLVVLGVSGFYSSGNQIFRVAFTALPLTLGSLVISCRYLDRRPLTDLGISLTLPGWWAEYGFGAFAGFIAGGSLVFLLNILGWASMRVSFQWKTGFLAFLGAFLISLISYLSVGIFEELMRAYQIKNTVEGLYGILSRWAGFLAVMVGAAWSVIAHVNRNDGLFLTYILVTTFLYGFFYLWTGRAALAMAFHFSWDFTVSSIFQLGSISEVSLYYVRILELPTFTSDPLSVLALVGKIIGFMMVVVWIKRKEGALRMNAELPKAGSLEQAVRKQLSQLEMV